MGGEFCVCKEKFTITSIGSDIDYSSIDNEFWCGV